MVVGLNLLGGVSYKLSPLSVQEALLHASVKYAFFSPHTERWAVFSWATDFRIRWVWGES